MLKLEVRIITGLPYRVLKCHWRQDRQEAGRNFKMRYSGFCWAWRKDACHLLYKLFGFESLRLPLLFVC